MISTSSSERGRLAIAASSSAHADALPPFGVKRFGTDIERAEGLVRRVTIAHQLDENAQIGPEALAKDLGRYRAFRIRDPRFGAVQVIEPSAEILECKDFARLGGRCFTHVRSDDSRTLASPSLIHVGTLRGAT